MNSITKTVFKVGDFVSWAKHNQLDLSPRFQRRPVWKSGAKSYLVDTVIRGLPIPIVFLRDRLSLKDLSTKREVVDGQQRLRTLLSYISPDLLSDYDPTIDSFQVVRAHNKEFAGKPFYELPERLRQSILGYEIPVHIFSADTEDRDILQIFARLNATGVKLNDQELRNAEYFGEFKSLCYRIAYEHLDRWQSWGVYKISEISRMTEVEDVSDLIISMEEGVHGKNKKVIDSYYEIFDQRYEHAVQIEKRFAHVMDIIASEIGEDLRNTVFSRRALFSDLFVALYHVLYGLGSPLKVSEKPARPPARLRGKLVEMSRLIVEEDIDEELSRSLRGATAHKGTRLERVNFILGELGYELTKG